ncbi:malate synthase A, partial [Streptomyces albidoflavus]
MPATALSHRVRVLAAPGARHDEILTPAALDFVGRLTAAFAGRRQGVGRGRRAEARGAAVGLAGGVTEG